jgi:hypothetical protein
MQALMTFWRNSVESIKAQRGEVSLNRWVLIVLSLVIIVSILPTAIDQLATLTGGTSLGSYAGAAAVFGLVAIAAAAGLILWMLRTTGGTKGN